MTHPVIPVLVPVGRRSSKKTRRRFKSDLDKIWQVVLQ